ncbi:MAG: group I intron-associated PD-(D/E)XK endonuclease [Candidatus Tumulicola sp.]
MERLPKRDTKSIGDRSEMEAMVALARAGYIVSAPFGENSRYDLIIDKDGILSRVQVKTGRLRNGVSCRSYAGEIEYFAVYCPGGDSVYLIPISEIAIGGTLRVDPTRNGQEKRIRWASEYALRREAPS